MGGEVLYRMFFLDKREFKKITYIVFLLSFTPFQHHTCPTPIWCKSLFFFLRKNPKLPNLFYSVDLEMTENTEIVLCNLTARFCNIILQISYALLHSSQFAITNRPMKFRSYSRVEDGNPICLPAWKFSLPEKHFLFKTMLHYFKENTTPLLNAELP